MLDNPHLTLERDGHVAIVTMNRPEAKNAWSLELMAGLADSWEIIDKDPEIRVAILTGAGGTFSAGADLKLMHSDQSDNPWHKRFRDDAGLHFRAMLRSPQKLHKPLVSAIEGYALGGGTEIIQATDIRIAGESSRFGLTECKMGLFPLGGSTVRLARQIPYTFAMDILLTGRLFSAAEALSYGLIGRVVPDGTALEEAMKVANKIASNGPLAVQAIKRSVLETADMTEEEGLAHELEIGQPIIFQTADAKEGARAFAERRKPNFKGN
ncbi:MAG: enoyl-CoA hydratase [Myxococcota bacterium]|jgi:enoyl-CoA hydratase